MNMGYPKLYAHCGSYEFIVPRAEDSHKPMNLPNTLVGTYVGRDICWWGLILVGTYVGRDYAGRDIYW